MDSGTDFILFKTSRRIDQQMKSVKRVTLIKPSAEQAITAAALSVGVGSYHELPQFPGLAHFCEHALFLGSSKYPEENGLDSVLR